MPVRRYARAQPPLWPKLTDRTWVANTIDRAPLWASVDLRDGNQALANPMDIRRKSAMFHLLVRMGFKEIEVGYPSASDADFTFVRTLITNDQIPDDVTISVFTPARLDLIDRTFEAIKGADRAMVHLCNATACLWREVVFEMSPGEVHRMAVESAEHIARRADRAKDTRLRFQYSPETFNVTEPDYVLRVCNTVVSTWEASRDRPVTLNLPTTVETDSPNIFADQVEWMHRRLDRRDSVILSVHPHNDRGTAVASAEMAVMAGADRVEGTLFGNGERTGNVCVPTLALNLFSRGINPQLDFSDIDEIRQTVEFANQLPVHPRHPYAGDLVYTAFSGTHQDAISKGLAAIERQAKAAGVPAAEMPWGVPYLPIDPKDVGRTYESVVRVNSQSGKGGIAHVLKSHYGLDLPRPMRLELAKIVQAVADGEGTELTSQQLWAIFEAQYLDPEQPPLVLKEFQTEVASGQTMINALLALQHGQEVRIEAHDADIASAFVGGLAANGIAAELIEASHESLTDHRGGLVAAYATVEFDGRAWHGAGLDNAEPAATLRAIISAVNRALIAARSE